MLPSEIASGVLIAFEGIDGSGKTTQAALLRDWVQGLGFEVVSTKEPTAGQWGAKIRNSKFSSRLPPQEELECFVHDRQEHVEKLIAPALSRGAVVVVDRYYYSTAAYQGARGLPVKDVLEMNRAFAPTPDIVFLLDLDPKTGLERIAGRGQGQDLFETLEELTKAREIFRRIAMEAQHVVYIDAAQTEAEVHAEVIFNLVRGPMMSRMHELGRHLEIPKEDPDYELLELAQSLTADPKVPFQEKIRRLLTYSNKKRHPH